MSKSPRGHFWCELPFCHHHLCSMLSLWNRRLGQSPTEDIRSIARTMFSPASLLMPCPDISVLRVVFVAETEKVSYLL